MPMTTNASVFMLIIHFRWKTIAIGEENVKKALKLDQKLNATAMMTKKQRKAKTMVDGNATRGAETEI